MHADSPLGVFTPEEAAAQGCGGGLGQSDCPPSWALPLGSLILTPASVMPEINKAIKLFGTYNKEKNELGHEL